MAHMDVVPVEPGTESSWIHGPFSGDVADGFVWGRGTIDDKVSVMAIFEAVEFSRAGFPSPVPTILLAFGHDERSAAMMVRPDRGPVEKARRRVRYVLDEGSAVTDGIVPGLSSQRPWSGLARRDSSSFELRPPRSPAIVDAATANGHRHRGGGSARRGKPPMPAALGGPAALLFDCLGPEMPF